jgi:hypothetical protein
MENGFIVNIINQNDVFKEIQLFSSELPKGVIVETLDKGYDFHSLQEKAKLESFKGNVLTTNIQEPLKCCIINMDKEQDILLNGRYEGSEMLMDGYINFIKVYCPANANFYIRLFSITNEE